MKKRRSRLHNVCPEACQARGGQTELNPDGGISRARELLNHWRSFPSRIGLKDIVADISWPGLNATRNRARLREVTIHNIESKPTSRASNEMPLQRCSTGSCSYVPVRPLGFFRHFRAWPMVPVCPCSPFKFGLLRCFGCGCDCRACNIQQCRAIWLVAV